ncbi:MAG: glycine--tRNA ligase subunit beta [Thermodesulfobacterium geofontis]|uniref:Glycine--tRNA ligase beta subunit n=1 Tax=Thermodesulfobacterium geofontis TaxID=1295609 RepID=A0A2N7PP32_9BACT|nr:MAG: glycine--tRNA ligase subunit beta [Thermodesulfobacterium geofontis]
MGKNLLWEIGTEELPARFIIPALESLKTLAENKLRENQLNFEEIKTAGTLRRLTLFVKNLSETQEEKEEEILGPSVKVGIDEKGNYTQAVIGFAKKYGVTPEKLIIKKTEKGDYFCLKRVILGKKTVEILPQILLTILRSIYFPKSMRWGYYEIRFARPIRWMLCLYGKEVIPLKVANVSASSFTLGHRFLSEKPIEISEADWENYERLLEENYVIVDPKKRILKTKEEILRISQKIGIPELEKDLLEENAHLVEYPFPVVGEFPKEFLNLPEPLVITALKEHQRYICLKDKKGKLINYFIAINNNLPKNLEILKKGHERVTKARLEDVKFYFEKDLKEPLKKKVEKLKGIVYHIKCGTLWDKTQRLIELGEYLTRKINPYADLKKIKKACFYAKADLASEVVKEFTSLQGIMGKIYAEYFGEKDIALALYEQYLPYSQNEILPETQEGIILSLTDKIDHLVSLFGSGEKPTGEADPYGLRRSAYGIIKILIGKKIFLNLEEAFSYGLRILEKQRFIREKDILDEILDFFRRRLEGEFLNLGFNKLLIGVVIKLPLDPFDLFLRIKALKEFQDKKDFVDLITGFKRVAQILKGLEINKLPELKPTLFEEKEEKELYSKLLELKPRLEDLLNRKEYPHYLERLLEFKELIDRFFDNVFVMVDKKELRENRLKLLAEVSSLFNSFGDLTYFI